MNILLITNLYPPQELGGYGRSMADFAWGLRKLGNKIKIICSDAPYLDIKPKQKETQIKRSLILKGSFKNGVNNILDPKKRKTIDDFNNNELKKVLSEEIWDGILIGNIDLIGMEILPTLLQSKLPILHHIGFMEPSFSPNEIPKFTNYKLISASCAVEQSLAKKGFITDKDDVVYPGARVELFGEKVTNRKLPDLPDGTRTRPLCIAFAGLLMSSKGLHTLIEALIKLKNKKIATRTIIAGNEFQHNYKSSLKKLLKENNFLDCVIFAGSLNREQLSRFFRLNHVLVFPSIFPEAFGIVQAEAMASGLAIISSGVGGSKELVQSGVNGWLFNSQDSDELSRQLYELAKKPQLIKEFGGNGEKMATNYFNTLESAKKLEAIFRKMSQ